MKIIKTGATRYVLIIGNLAFKFPSWFSWSHFLQGMVANMAEYQFSRVDIYQGKVCPILFRIPGGFLNVMPRCRIMTDEEFDMKAMVEFCRCSDDFYLPTEYKSDSYGWTKDGNLVAVDYAGVVRFPGDNISVLNHG